MKIEVFREKEVNWKAKCVVIFLAQYVDSDIEDAVYETKTKKVYRVNVSRYDNNREQGYIVSLICGKKGIVHYAIYEHRNCGNLCVVRFENETTTPTEENVWEIMKDKHDITKDFNWGEIVDCGNWICEDIKTYIK